MKNGIEEEDFDKCEEEFEEYVENNAEQVAEDLAYDNVRTVEYGYGNNSTVGIETYDEEWATVNMISMYVNDIYDA